MTLVFFFFFLLACLLFSFSPLLSFLPTHPPTTPTHTQACMKEKEARPAPHTQGKKKEEEEEKQKKKKTGGNAPPPPPPPPPPPRSSQDAQHTPLFHSSKSTYSILPPTHPPHPKLNPLSYTQRLVCFFYFKAFKTFFALCGSGWVGGWMDG